MNNNSNKITIENYIILKRTHKNAVWHYYFKLDGKQLRKSTKCTDFEGAEIVALKDYNDATNRLKSGLPINGMSFNDLCKRYDKTLEGQNKLIFHSETLGRHFKPFFGKFKDINTIRKSDIAEYVQHRKDKYRKQNKREPLPQTINKEAAVFNQMMRYATNNDWLTTGITIERSSERMSHNRRPHFNDGQYKKLISKSYEHLNLMKTSIIEQGKDPVDNSKYTNAALLRDIILILAHSGMRVDEIKTVRWCDVDMNKGYIKLNKAGKTKSHRELFVRSEGIASFKNIRNRREDYLKKHGGNFDENERIHTLPNGKYIQSFKKGFIALLKRCGFVYDKTQTRHTLTSLRHTYATYRLKTPTKDKTYIPMDRLSIQMGTSVKMIQKHYGHLQLSDFQDMFR